MAWWVAPVVQTAIGGAGALIGGKKDEKARAAYEANVMATAAPSGEELAIRNELASDARAALSGELPAALKLKYQREHNRGAGALARQMMLEQAGLSSALARTGRLGSASGDAIMARGAVEAGMRRDALSDNYADRLGDATIAGADRGRATLGAVADAYGRDRQTRLAALGGLGYDQGGAQLGAASGALAREAIAELFKGWGNNGGKKL
jgi:hypothetical protein